MYRLIGLLSADYLTLIAAVVILLLLITLWTNQHQSDKGELQYTFPIVKPSHSEFGSLTDVKEAGGIHNYLVDLHKKHGTVVGFYWGKELALSLGSVSAFKAISNLFDRPVNQFLSLKPLIGTSSIQYSNGEIGKAQRNVLDKLYSHTSVEGYTDIIVEVGEELVSKWKKVGKDEHVPVIPSMMAIALKSISRSSFGDYFKSDAELLKFEEAYDICMKEMEINMEGDEFAEGSDREKSFMKALDHMKDVVAKIVSERRNMKEKKKINLLDIMLENKDLFPTDEVVFDHAISYFVAGFHTTGYLMTWAVYYLSSDEDVQNKLFQEISTVLADKEFTFDLLPKLEYTRQVIDESLRTSVLAGFAARFSEEEILIDGHVVPRKTPLITGLGVLLHAPALWPDPEKFDPERFSIENRKKIPSVAFSPFGYAGKRKCPGYRFAYLEATVFLVQLVKNFKFHVVEGQDIKPCRRFVAEPNTEIWITIETRD